MAEPEDNRDGATAEKPAPEAGPSEEPKGDVMGGLMGALLRRGRAEIERLAVSTRFRLDLRQLRHDRDAMYQKVGREVRALMEGGEITHPGLARSLDRIRELEAKILKVESESLAAGVAPEPETPSEG